MWCLCIFQWNNIRLGTSNLLWNLSCTRNKLAEMPTSLLEGIWAKVAQCGFASMGTSGSKWLWSLKGELLKIHIQVFSFLASFGPKKPESEPKMLLWIVHIFFKITMKVIFSSIRFTIEISRKAIPAVPESFLGIQHSLFCWFHDPKLQLESKSLIFLSTEFNVGTHESVAELASVCNDSHPRRWRLLFDAYEVLSTQSVSYHGLPWRPRAARKPW